jgi:agmatine deiminase
MQTTRWPAEWERQEGALLCWPSANSDWAENLNAAESVYIDIVLAISKLAHVYICCDTGVTCQRARDLCRQNAIADAKISFTRIPYDDTWSRDFGPVSVYQGDDPGHITWIDFDFNAWGGKYPCSKDKRLTQQLHAALFKDGRDLLHAGLVLEGGSIDSDGCGSVLTTSECLLSNSRNPGIGKTQLEQKLQDLLGARHVLWLDHGHLVGDDTDAHIDTLARFCSRDTICYVQCTDAGDPHYSSLQRMQQQLETFRQQTGEPYRLIPLPLPAPCYNDAGYRLPATYANFLILNGAVLVPLYDVETDSAAMAQLGKCFPSHELVAIHCRPLIEQFGSLHCVTMQIA